MRGSGLLPLSSCSVSQFVPLVVRENEELGSNASSIPPASALLSPSPSTSIWCGVARNKVKVSLAAVILPPQYQSILPIRDPVAVDNRK